MRYFLLPLLFIFFTIGASAQDTTGISFKNEIFPVYSGVKSRLGEGISFEVRKELATKSKLGIGYSKMTFGQHTSRNMELVFYKESDQENKVQVDLGFGFFVRQWSDVVNKDQSTEMYEQKSMTTGYVVSFGAKANLSSSVAFATRLLVNNNTNFDLTYSLRPGIIISI